MEFAGKDSIYLSQKKRDKILQIKKSNEENKAEAPKLNTDIIMRGEDNKDRAELSNKIKEESTNTNDPLNKIKMVGKGDSEKSDSDSNSYIDLNDAELMKDFDIDDVECPPPESTVGSSDKTKYKSEADVNVLFIQYNTLSKPSESTLSTPYKCQQCGGYLNCFSKLIPIQNKPNYYEWTCEFCKNKNTDLQIASKNDIPVKSEVEYILQKPQAENINDNNKNKDNASEDDYSLIFCYDVSGSMSNTYRVPENLRKVLDDMKRQKSNLQARKNKYDFIHLSNSSNRSITRLELVKIAIESNINSLLKKSPKVKVGLVSFGSDVLVNGDCKSNIIQLKEKDTNNEEKIISLGEENTNLIKHSIKDSSDKVIKVLNQCTENGCTALGPAALLSISLLKNSKIGSRIFLCTDGCSNTGVGDISNDKAQAKTFYDHLGEIAKERGIIISLITFEDAESEIEVLMDMVSKSGGDIIRVNPKEILDGFNDLLENKSISTQTKLTVNLEKCLTFKDEDFINMKNDKSSLTKEIGNTSVETETYIEFKFKKAFKLAEMKEYDFNNLSVIIFQSVIDYMLKNGGKYTRVISKLLKVSQKKNEIEKIANYDIISTNAMQKVAMIAQRGDFKVARIKSHATKKLMQLNSKVSASATTNIKEYCVNMRDFDKDLIELDESKNYNSSNAYKSSNDRFSQQVYSISKCSRTTKTKTYTRKSGY